MNPVEQKIVNALVDKLGARFDRVYNRKFAPFRVLRYRLILKKIRAALHGCHCTHHA